MLFNSLEFALFFATCLALTLALPHRAQNRFLLAASYLFYGAWDWRFLGLIAVSTLVDYAVALGLGRSDDRSRRRLLLGASLVVNLGILGFFKYAGFFAQSLADLFALGGFALSPFTLQVVLPVGISFYTFQTLSYTIDVYRGEIEPTRNLLDFALYVAFFPQLVAGPIERGKRLLPQILAPRRVRFDDLGTGAWLVFWGVFKKAVIADNLAKLVEIVYAPTSDPTGAELLVGTYAFAIQIYCDFSGYTDVARGAARMLGFDIMRNFDLPYLADSVSDFWRRWHVSLSSWLRDYLYIPLGGNRRGSGRTHVNLMITMLLGGLWHGAAWNFVLWGAFHGGLLVLHRELRPMLGRVRPRSATVGGLWRGLCIAFVFHCVCLGWLIFRAESLDHLLQLLDVLAAPWTRGSIGAWLLPLAVLVCPLVLVQSAQVVLRDQEPVRRFPLLLRSALYLGLAVMLVLMGEDGGRPFVYFQF